MQMQVEIIIHYLKPNNLYLSFPSNMQIISQEQLNVDIFSSQESWSGAAPRMRTSSQCLCCKYLQYLQYWQIFGHPNTMLDWRANSNIILHTNIRVCPNTVYSNAGFNNCGSFVGMLSILWKFFYHSFHIVEVSFSILLTLWKFC